MSRMKLRYANVAATLAVVIAVGGTSPFAAGKPTGPTASSDLGLVRVYRKKVNLPSPTPVNYSGKFTVLCPEGQQPIAGGGRGVITITNSYPTTSANGTAPLTTDAIKGWTISGGATPLLVGASQTVYVVCVD